MLSEDPSGAVPVEEDPPRLSSSSTKNQTIVDTIKAPRLNNVTYLDFIKFKKARENYEREVDEKNKEPGVNIQKASSVTSVEPTVLELLVERSYIERGSIKDVTAQDIIGCIEKMCERPKGDFELPDVEKAVKSVRIKPNIPGAEPRIDTLLLDYKRALEAAGYPDFPQQCPKIAIGHIYNRLKPPLLKEMIFDEFEKQDAKGLRKKNFRYFIKEVVRIAKDVEKTNSRWHGTQSGSSEEKSGFCKGKGKGKKKGGGDKGAGDKPSDEKAGNKRERIVPECLHPECKKTGERQYVKFCPYLKDNDELRNKLLDEWRKANGKEKKKYKPGNMKSMAAEIFENHSTLFRAKFSESIEARVLADNCADDNLMPPDIFERLRSSVSKLQVTTLTAPLEYNLAVEARSKDGFAKVVCDKIVTADVELHIRHGSSLILRGVQWLVSHQAAQPVLIGRPLLEALGLDTKSILEAASDKQNGIINFLELLPVQIEPKLGTLAKFIHDSGVFHCDSGYDGYDPDEGIYIDLGEDQPGEVWAALQASTQEAKEAGMSETGHATLQDLFKDLDDVFHFRLGKTLLTKMEPMVVKLKMGARPVISKARRYKPDQRQFLNKYITELERMGFVCKTPEAQWAAAPLLVHKPNFKAKYRMTVDLRVVK